MMGISAGLIVSKQSQDIRQQATISPVGPVPDLRVDCSCGQYKTDGVACEKNGCDSVYVDKPNGERVYIDCHGGNNGNIPFCIELTCDPSKPPVNQGCGANGCPANTQRVCSCIDAGLRYSCQCVENNQCASPPGNSSPPPSTPTPSTTPNPGSTPAPPGGSSGSPSNNKPMGFLDVITSDCTIAKGWACDADNFGAAIKVRLYDGPAGTGKYLGEVTANEPREAGVGSMCGGQSNRGYTFSLPASIRDGKQHTIYAHGINIGGGSDNQLAKSPMTVTCPNTSGSPGGGTAALPNSGTFSHSCDTSGSTIGFNLSVNNTSPANVGTVSFFLGFWGKYHNKALTDDFLGKPTWSTTCHDQEWCGYHLRFVQDPNPTKNDESIGFKWDNSYKIGSNQRTLAQIAQKIDDLKASGDLPATYQLPIHVEYRLPNGSRYNLDGNNTKYLNVTKNSCSLNNKKVVIMAKSTKLDEVYAIMQLKYKGKLVKQWNTNDKLRSYEAEVPAVTKISDLTVHFVNDANKPPLQDRNLTVRSLKLGDATYMSDSVSTYSTGTWSKNVGCSPGNKRSDTLHCNGFFRYSQDNDVVH